MWKIALPIMAVVAVLFVACGDDDDDTSDGGSDQAAADQALCDSLATFGGSITALQELTSSDASQEEIDGAIADVRQSWAQVVEDAADADAEAAAETLELTYTNLDEAAALLPEDASSQQTAAALAEELTSVINTYTQINSDLNCAE
jgi:hypothetical protein